MITATAKTGTMKAGDAVRGRAGFSLAEMLVVIAIIAILMALLVPAVQAAREMARRAACFNNLYVLGTGAAKYDQSQGYLPGWRTPAAGSPDVGWAMALMPYIDRNLVYDAYIASGGNFASPNLASAEIGTFLCPTSTPADIADAPAQISYGGNCGVGVQGLKWAGVMNDASASGNRLSLEDINAADGTALTLMLAEKCGPNIAQARWNNAPLPTNVLEVEGGRTPPRFGLKSGGISSGAGNVNNQVINNTKADVVHTVPSSKHSGGVVAALCSAEVRFLKDTVDAGVYAQLITSSHTGAGTINGWTPRYPISEADLK